jgi:hypothetical protein
MAQMIMSPRKVPTRAKEFDLVMEFSSLFSKVEAVSQRAAIVLKLAQALLDAGCLQASTAFARACLEMSLSDTGSLKEEACVIMQRGEIAAVVG